MFNLKDIKETFKKLNLSRKSNILNITHTDLDGAACTIVLKSFFDFVDVKNSTYSNIDELLRTVEYSYYDAVFVTDISPRNPESLDRSKKIVLIDHHESAVKYHDPSKDRYVSMKACGSVLTKVVLSKMFNDDKKQLNEFLYHVNDYDLWLNKHDIGKKLNELYFKYWAGAFVLRFRDGKINFHKDEIAFLNSRKKAFEDLYESTEYNDLETINGCVFSVSEFNNDICDRLLREEKYDIVINKNLKSKSVSIRSSINNKYPEFNLGKILESLDLGGGHITAGGMISNSAEDFESKVKTLEKYLYDNFEQVRIS